MSINEYDESTIVNENIDAQFDSNNIEDNNMSTTSFQIISNDQTSQSFYYDSQISENNKSSFIQNIKEGPIKLIEFSKNHFILNKMALNILHTIREPIVVVSIVGKARTGKSYLMNLLLNVYNNTNNNNTKNNNDGFQVASLINSCTKGIWLWNTPRQKPNSSDKIIFIDSEGTNSVDLSTKAHDSKIFSLIILLSSLFIYNTNGNIDEQAINELALSTYLSNIIAVNDNTNINKDKIIRELAPKFIWTLRDFTLDKIDPETGEEITSDEYLELCLRNKSKGKNSKQNNIIRENIIKYFKERECITLPRPVDKEEDLQHLHNIPFNHLKSNFRTEFLMLKKKVYETSKPKIFNGKKITGPILADLLIKFVNSINSGIIPNINNIWDNIIFDEIQTVYENCRYLWKLNIDNIKNDINIKLLYDIKYIIINEYNKIIENNKEIRHNNDYFKTYKEYKNKLDNDIQKDIKKIISTLNSRNLSSIKDAINKHKAYFILNISNSAYNNKDNNTICDILMNDYNNLFNNIKNNNIISNNNKDILNLICKTDLNYTEEIISYINSNLKQKVNKKIFDIEKEIKMNENEIFSDENILRLNNINKDLEDKYNNLKNELNDKGKEIMHIIGKYTKIIEKRDEILANKEINNMKSTMHRNNFSLRNSKLKSSINQFYYETDTKSCGCEFNNDICIIF